MCTASTYSEADRDECGSVGKGNEISPPAPQPRFVERDQDFMQAFAVRIQVASPADVLVL